MKKLTRVAFARKRKGRTDYRKRLKLLASNKLRLVIRKTSKNIIVQIVDFNPEGDKVLISTYSKELHKLGWKANTSNTPAAYLVGLLCGIKAKKKGIKEAILDTGLNVSVKKSLIYAALKGIIDSGLKVASSKEVLPTEERISGKHIVEYAKSLSSKNPEKYKKQFSIYLKNNLKPEDLEKHFKDIKNKIKENAKEK